MAATRKRRLDPQMWDDEAVFGVSRDARLLFVGLITQADDDGRLLGRGRWLQSKLYPEDEDLAPTDIESWLEQLHVAGLIWLYEVEGKTYIFLPGWKANQHIDKRYYQESKLPEPPSSKPAREEHASDTRAAQGDGSEPPAGASRDALGTAQGGPARGPRPIGEDGSQGEGSEEQPRSPEASPPSCEGGTGSTDSPSSLPATEEPKRSEVQQEAKELCELLADLVAENDPNHKRPKVSEEWLVEADRMLRIDQRKPEEAQRLIRWTQKDLFWRKNVRSMPKFREQYSQLYLAAVEDTAKRRKAEKREEHPADRRVRELREADGGEPIEGQAQEVAAA